MGKNADFELGDVYAHVANLALFFGLATIAFFAPSELKPIFAGYAFGFVVFGLVSIVVAVNKPWFPIDGIGRYLNNERVLAGIVAGLGGALSLLLNAFEGGASASVIFLAVSILTVSTSVGYPENGRFRIQHL